MYVYAFMVYNYEATNIAKVLYRVMVRMEVIRFSHCEMNKNSYLRRLREH